MGSCNRSKCFEFNILSNWAREFTQHTAHSHAVQFNSIEILVCVCMDNLQFTALTVAEVFLINPPPLPKRQTQRIWGAWRAAGGLWLVRRVIKVQRAVVFNSP